MGEILKFSEVRERKSNFEVVPKSDLAYRNRPERWIPIWERELITPKESTPSIIHAVKAFRGELEKLKKEGIPFQLDKEDWIWMRGADYELLPENYAEIKKLPEHTKAEIILTLCRSTHDGWVYDYYENFFSFFLDWEYVFFPIELIGVEQFYAIYDPLENMLPRIGLDNVDWEVIIDVYDRQRREFLDRYGVKKPADLILKIEQIANDYPALRPEILEVVSNRRLAYDIAGQISRYSAEIFQKSRV